MANVNGGPPNGSYGDSWNVVVDGVDSVLRQFRNIYRKPVTLQMGIGAGAGLATGYIFGKTSKLVAVVAGVSLISVQFMNYRGYLKFNRSQLRRDLDDLQSAVRKELGLRNSALPDGKEVDDFLSKNAYLLCGYVAGSLIGYGLT